MALCVIAILGAWDRLGWVLCCWCILRLLVAGESSWERDFVLDDINF
jgi:hypothetical protein